MVGSYIISIANLVLFLFPNFWMIIAMRAVSALGFGIVIPATVPMTNFLVFPSKIE